jgi:hypothetical protein
VQATTKVSGLQRKLAVLVLVCLGAKRAGTDRLGLIGDMRDESLMSADPMRTSSLWL